MASGKRNINYVDRDTRLPRNVCVIKLMSTLIHLLSWQNSPVKPGTQRHCRCDIELAEHVPCAPHCFELSMRFWYPYRVAVATSVSHASSTEYNSSGLEMKRANIYRFF